MKRQTVVEGVAFVLMVTLGIALRIYFQYLPNFAPVAALALFAGYFFRSAWVAVAVPLTVMVGSDLVIGGYQWYVMTVVYAMLSLPVMLRGVLRRRLRLDDSDWLVAAFSLGALLVSSLGSSLAFFLVTNFPAWLYFNSYEPNLRGLLTCYWQALPFYRYTLAGDLLFALLLFGGYGLALRRGYVHLPQTKVALE